MPTATATKLSFIPRSAVMKFKADIHAKLADALAALRVADTKLHKAAVQYTDAHSSIYGVDLWEARSNVRVFVRLLAATITSAPSLAPRVFSTIAQLANQEPRNTPHLEGAILALKLAQMSLQSALEMVNQFDGGEIDDDYEVAMAAHGTFSSYACMLESAAIGGHPEQALEAILAGKRLPSPEALRKVWMKKYMPNRSLAMAA